MKNIVVCISERYSEKKYFKCEYPSILGIKKYLLKCESFSLSKWMS